MLCTDLPCVILQICDGLTHCVDGSDEENCTVECSSAHVQCGDTAQCILKKYDHSLLLRLSNAFEKEKEREGE